MRVVHVKPRDGHACMSDTQCFPFFVGVLGIDEAKPQPLHVSHLLKTTTTIRNIHSNLDLHSSHN